MIEPMIKYSEIKKQLPTGSIHQTSRAKRFETEALAFIKIPMRSNHMSIWKFHQFLIVTECAQIAGYS